MMNALRNIWRSSRESRDIEIPRLGMLNAMLPLLPTLFAWELSLQKGAHLMLFVHATEFAEAYIQRARTRDVAVALPEMRQSLCLLPPLLNPPSHTVQ